MLHLGVLYSTAINILTGNCLELLRSLLWKKWNIEVNRVVATLPPPTVLWQPIRGHCDSWAGSRSFHWIQMGAYMLFWRTEALNVKGKSKNIFIRVESDRFCARWVGLTSFLSLRDSSPLRKVAQDFRSWLIHQYILDKFILIQTIKPQLSESGKIGRGWIFLRLCLFIYLFLKSHSDE